MFEEAYTFLAVLNAAAGSPTSPAGLAAGSGAFFDESGSHVTTDATGSTSKVFFAWKDAAGVIHKSPLIRGSKLKNAISKAPASKVEQVSFLGYNGSTGSITAAANTYYSVRLVLNHTFGLVNASPLLKTIPFKTSSSATQEGIALGLAAAGARAWGSGVNKDVIVEAVCAGTGTAAVETYTVSNGSRVIVGSAASTLSAGDIVRIGSAATTTDPIYKVESVSGTDATLTFAFQGADASGVTVATVATPGNCGLKFTGNTPSISDPTAERPFVVEFDVQVGDALVDSSVTLNTAASLGSGTYELVAAQEALHQFEDKDRIVSTRPRTKYRIDAVSGNSYKVLSVEASDSDFVDATTGVNPISKMRLVLAIESSLTTDASQLETVTNATVVS